MAPSTSPAKVSLPGVPTRLAGLVLVGVLAVLVGISVLGKSGDEPSASPVARVGAAASGTPSRTPAATATPEPTPAPTGPGRGWGRSRPTGGTPLPDVAGAVPGDDGTGPLPMGEVTELPNPDRLDFLFELDGFRDAHWMDPEHPTMGSGVWTAGRPFHVREGFVNEGEEQLGEGFDVVLYVTRLEDGSERRTSRYTSDYVLRGTSDRCGPTYETQAGPRTCEWFVHDFPEGLPEGRWAIWAAWEAPCRAWVNLGLADSCVDPDEVVSLFASGFDAPYRRSGPNYNSESG